MNPMLEEEEQPAAVPTPVLEEEPAVLLLPEPDAAPSLKPRPHSPPTPDPDQQGPAAHNFAGAWFEPEDVLVMNKEGQQRSLRRKGDLDVMEAGLHSLSFDLHCQIGHERERQRHEERQMVFNARRYAEGLQSTVRVRQLVGQVSGKEHMFVQNPRPQPKAPLIAQPEVEVEEVAPPPEPLPAPSETKLAPEPLPLQAPLEPKPWVVPVATDPLRVAPVRPPPKELTSPTKIPFQNCARRMSEVGRTSRTSSVNVDIGPPVERGTPSVNVDYPIDDYSKVGSKVDTNKDGVAPSISGKGRRPSISNKQPSLHVSRASLGSNSLLPELPEQKPEVRPKNHGPPPMAQQQRQQQQQGLVVSPAPIAHQHGHCDPPASIAQQSGLMVSPAPTTQQHGHWASPPVPIAKPQGPWTSPAPTQHSAPQSKRQSRVGRGSILFDIREKPQSVYEPPQPLHWWGNPRQSSSYLPSTTHAFEGNQSGLLSSKSFPRQNRLKVTAPQGRASAPAFCSTSSSVDVSSYDKPGFPPMVGQSVLRSQLQELLGIQEMQTTQRERQARARPHNFLQLSNGHIKESGGARKHGWDHHPQLRGLGHQQGQGSDGMGFVLGSRAWSAAQQCIKPSANAPGKVSQEVLRASAPEKVSQEVQWRGGLGGLAPRTEGSEAAEGGVGVLEGGRHGVDEQQQGEGEEAVARAGMLEGDGHGVGKQQQGEGEEAVAMLGGGAEGQSKGEGVMGGKDEESKGSEDGSGRDAPSGGDEGNGLGEGMEDGAKKAAANGGSLVAAKDSPVEKDGEVLHSASAELRAKNGQSKSTQPGMQDSTVAAPSPAPGTFAAAGDGCGAGLEGADRLLITKAKSPSQFERLSASLEDADTSDMHDIAGSAWRAQAAAADAMAWGQVQQLTAAAWTAALASEMQHLTPRQHQLQRLGPSQANLSIRTTPTEPPTLLPPLQEARNGISPSQSPVSSHNQLQQQHLARKHSPANKQTPQEQSALALPAKHAWNPQAARPVRLPVSWKGISGGCHVESSMVGGLNQGGLHCSIPGIGPISLLQGSQPRPW